MSTILVQGAMQEEIELLARMLPGGRWTEQKGYSFYETGLREAKIILALTQVGILHACISTMLGIEGYKPDALINQGTAGGHVRTLEIGDIVIGETAVYINSMQSPIRKKGAGSNALEWIPLETKGSALLEADPKLVRAAEQTPYAGTLLRGRLGSGDLFSRETDRIDLLHAQFGQLCEDMESAAVYKVCHLYRIPVIGIRIISNNELTGRHEAPGAVPASAGEAAGLPLQISAGAHGGQGPPSRPTAILFQKQPIFKKKIKINCTLTAPYRFSIITIRINRHGVLYEAEGLA